IAGAHVHAPEQVRGLPRIGHPLDRGRQHGLRFDEASRFDVRSARAQCVFVHGRPLRLRHAQTSAALRTVRYAFVNAIATPMMKRPRSAPSTPNSTQRTTAAGLVVTRAIICNNPFGHSVLNTLARIRRLAGGMSVKSNPVTDAANSVHGAVAANSKARSKS